MIKETIKLVVTEDNQKIAIWKVSDNLQEIGDNNSQNILLIHGAFSDKRVCLGIAGFLAKRGHTCYIMEWRGRGNSSKPQEKFNFETVARYDVKATVQYLVDELKLTNLHCITHSGGGICLTMFLIRHPQYIQKINSMSLFACQVYGAALNPKSYAKITLLRSITKVVKHLPAKKFKMGSINESHYTMSQWYRWNLHQHFKSDFDDSNSVYSTRKKHNFDYQQHMPKVTIPIYAICAKGDDFVAPPKGCQLFIEDFKNPANTYYEFSLDNSNLEDYDHTRVIMSLNASKEIWPSVLAWIEQHRT